MKGMKIIGSKLNQKEGRMPKIASSYKADKKKTDPGALANYSLSVIVKN